MTPPFSLMEDILVGSDLENASASSEGWYGTTPGLRHEEVSSLRRAEAAAAPPPPPVPPLRDLYTYELLSLTAACVFIIAIVGTIGNVLAATSLLLSKKLRQSPSTAFMVNLLACLLPVCAVGMPMFGVVFISVRDYGEIPYTDEVAISSFVLGLILSQVHIHTICALAFNRLMAVMWPMTYKKVMQPRRVRLYLLMIWLYSALLWVPLFFGINGKLEIEREELMVSMRDESRHKIGKVFHVFFTYLLPVLFSAICYVTMYVKVRQSRQRKVARQRCKTAVETTEDNVIRLWDDDVTRTILVIFLVLLSCSVPHVVVHVLHLHEKFPAAWLLLHVVFWFQFCVDPVVYVSMSHQYRRATFECLDRIFRSIGFLRPPEDDPSLEPRNELKADSNINLQSTWRKNMDTHQKFQFVTEVNT